MTDDTLDEESLRDLQARTAKLPRSIDPPADAWDRIRAEIERPEAVAVRSIGRVGPAFWQKPAFLAAAALLLVAGTSIVTAISMARGRELSDVTKIPAIETPAPNGQRTSGTPATLAEFTAVENDYISTANRLSQILESGETELSPETILKLKESLRVIDAAILEARRALAADPANTKLIEILSTSYNQKVDLLRRTTEMGRS